MGLDVLGCKHISFITDIADVLESLLFDEVLYLLEVLLASLEFCLE